MSEILQHISSPDEQFTVGLNLVQKAFSSKQSQYNSEVTQLRNYVKQKTDENAELRTQMNDMRREMKDREDKVRIMEETLMKTRSEKENLLEQVKRLTRELSKLQQFKKSIIASINEDEYQTRENIGSYTPGTSFNTSNRMNSTLNTTRSSINSPSASVLNNSSVLSSSSPQKSYPSNAPTNTPNQSYNGLLEGKQFFKKAKIELSHEAFNAFLNCIKKFNSKMLSKDETLRNVKQIFGDDHGDLFLSFEMILDKHSDGFSRD